MPGPVPVPQQPIGGPSAIGVAEAVSEVQNALNRVLVRLPSDRARASAARLLEILAGSTAEIYDRQERR